MTGEESGSVIQRLASWAFQKTIARPSCAVCGNPAVGKGPLNDSLCVAHAKERWDDVE